MAAERGDGAFEFLFADLVERIMSFAGDPRRCVAYIAEEIRALAGARTILVLECPDLRGGEEHRLVSVLPERRRDLAADLRVHEIIERAHELGVSAFIESGEDSEIGRALAGLGIGDSILLPLRYAATKSGIVLILDLMDRANIRSLLSAFDRLSPILALIMRNGYLYENLEAEVDRRTQELEASLREKEVMLKEIHHRVKNNLQIVSSLLYLRMSGIADEGTRALFAESQNRVLAIALVHEELYSSPDLSRIDMKDYLSKLVGRLISISPVPVSVAYDLEPALLGPDEAIPCGLLVDELVMNAMKHAFAGRAGGKLAVALKETPGRLELEVADDGPGLDPALFDGRSGGLGLSIIKSLVEQLRGTIVIEPGPGARFMISFPCGEAGA